MIDAGKIPILFPLPLVDRAAGAKRMAAFGAKGNPTEDALTNMVVCPVVRGTFSEICLCLVKLQLRNQRLMGVFGDGPVFLGNRNLFLGLDADLPALAQKCVSQINGIFKNSLDRGIVPRIRCPGGAFFTEFIPKQDSIFQRRDDSVRI